MWETLQKVLDENPFTGMAIGFILGTALSYYGVLKGYLISPSIQRQLAEDKAKIENLERWLKQNDLDLKICENNIQEWRRKAAKESEENRRELKRLTKELISHRNA